ncbi:MAG: biopolymer transporter ExbD [Lentisphaerae bacterium]|nr:biopolymer transporter ExbD [Lentisphaerota bacterium]
MTMTAHERRARRSEPPVKISSTAMIDVVFLLLVFFVFTVSPQDILARLEVSGGVGGGDSSIPMLRIDVLENGFTLNDKPAGEAELERLLSRFGDISPDIGVMISCRPGSPHSLLIRALDTCAGAGLKNVAMSNR